MTQEQDRKVLVAMSGGLHSVVAAGLLRSQGYDVHALHIRLADGQSPGAGLDARCAGDLPPEGVAGICERLGIPFHLADARDLYREKVIDRFIHECLLNRLTNPCIPCNQEVKFRVLTECADRLGFHWVATGHSAVVVHDAAGGSARLQRSTDRKRDQSYYLYGLAQETLRRLLLPLGGLQEAMIGKLAREFGLPAAAAGERCDACYVNDPRARDLIDRSSPASLRSKGMIRSVDGIIVGEHSGLHRYSIGQSEGLDITVTDEEAYYVLGFDLSRQALVVGPERKLYHGVVTASSVSWVQPQDGLRGLRCTARVRPLEAESECSVTLFENETVRAVFDKPHRALCPGQAIVFYDGDDVLGGAIIDEVGEGGRAP